MKPGAGMVGKSNEGMSQHHAPTGRVRVAAAASADSMHSTARCCASQHLTAALPRGPSAPTGRQRGHHLLCRLVHHVRQLAIELLSSNLGKVFLSEAARARTTARQHSTLFAVVKS